MSRRNPNEAEQGPREAYGTILYVAVDDDLFEEDLEKIAAHGLSERFVEIMKELHAQGIQYVRFDADGNSIDGMEPCY